MRRATAGRVTSTGRAWSISAGRPVSRTGATSPAARVVDPAGSMSYSLTNSTASPDGEATRIRTVGAPTTSTGSVKGTETKAACWPGTSATTPLTNEASPPADGTEEIAAGFPPGGLRHHRRLTAQRHVDRCDARNRPDSPRCE